MKKIKKSIYYIAYTLVAIGCFLYLLFPSQTFKGVVSTYLLKMLPGYQIQFDGLQPILPLGLGFESVSVLQNDRMWAQIDRLNITPRIASLLSPRKTINYRGKAYQGALRGHMDVNMSDKSTQTDIFLTLADIQLSDISSLQEELGRKLTGFLNGDVELMDNNGPKRNLKGKLDLTDVRIELSNPIINIQEVALNLVEAEFNVNKQVFSLKRLEAKGGQVEGSLTGTIMIREPMGKSRINLRGSFFPREVLLAGIKDILPGNLFKQQMGDKGMPIRIYGTIEKPKYSFR
ncbi:type II secretion system protein GspN [Thermodesulfobacteriota bacterium]